jgi:hypothetical protein
LLLYYASIVEEEIQQTVADFRRIIPWQGFDKYSTPMWQMVPMNGKRYVCLRAGAGLTVSANDPSSLRVTEVTAAQLPGGDKDPIQAGDRFFKLEGLLWQTLLLQAKTAAGVVVAELEVDIKNKVEKKLAFNFVRDNAGHRTRRAVASAAAWLSGINWIYNGQTNIFFRQTVARNVVINQDLGPVVRFATGIAGVPASEHEWDIVVATGDGTADMNFFFVWEYEQSALTVIDGTDAGTLGGNCVFEDQAGSQIAETLCHEIGHFLNCDDHYVAANKHELMYGITDARGAHIGKEHANIMNL